MIINQNIFIQNQFKDPQYLKMSENDKPGMAGDRSEIDTSFNYTPKGFNVEISRPQGSLRMKRGDTKLKTLIKDYPTMSKLMGFSYDSNLQVCRMVTGNTPLWMIRESLQVVDIKSILKKVREKNV
jgi:hypothetical protein